MNGLEQIYPLLLLHLCEYDDKNVLDCLPDITSQHAFVYGPMTRKTILHIHSFIDNNYLKKVFWKVEGGIYQDCIEFENILKNPQIHLFFDEPIEKMAMACAQASENLDFSHYCFTNCANEKLDFDQFNLLYVLDYYYINEKKGFCHIAKNILTNLKEHHEWYDLKHAKEAFKGHPLIIVGAGSSLDRHLSFLKQQASKIPIMAIGSAIAICHDKGIQACFGVACCPNKLSYERLKNKNNCRILFSQPRSHPGILNAFQGKKVILNQTSSFGFSHLNQILGHCPISEMLPIGSTTVASLALAIATYLGFGPIIFCGVDLAYGDKDYAAELSSPLKQQRFYPEILAFEELAQRNFQKIYSLEPLKGFQHIEEISHPQLMKFCSLYKGQEELKLDEVFKKKQLDLTNYVQSIKNLDGDSSLIQEEVLNFLTDLQKQEFMNQFLPAEF